MKILICFTKKRNWDNDSGWGRAIKKKQKQNDNKKLILPKVLIKLSNIFGTLENKDFPNN